MNINSEVEVEANLQIGPTSDGMVRLFIEAKGIEVPLDFDPDEADEIAEEIKSAAAAARAALTYNISDTGTSSADLTPTTFATAESSSSLQVLGVTEFNLSTDLFI